MFKENFPYNNELTSYGFIDFGKSLKQNIAFVNISNDLCYYEGSLSSRPESLFIKQSDNIKNLYNSVIYHHHQLHPKSK